MKDLKFAASVVNLAILICFEHLLQRRRPRPGRRTSRAAAAGQMRAPCLPDAVANGKAAVAGAADPQQRLKLAIHLPLRNQAELTQLLHDLYDPKSPKFHKYLSVAAFTERFGATAADYNAVVAWAKANGLTVTATTPNRRLVAVEGSVNTVNRAFHVTIKNYRHPTEGRIFYSPDREPTLRRTECAAAADHRHEQLCSAAFDAAAPGQWRSVANGSGPSGEYLPSDMRAAYYGNGSAHRRGPIDRHLFV